MITAALHSAWNTRPSEAVTWPWMQVDVAVALVMADVVVVVVVWVVVEAVS